jgi:hypothetical protein
MFDGFALNWFESSRAKRKRSGGGLRETRYEERVEQTLRSALAFLFLLGVRGWGVNPKVRISQYGHTAWRIQDGFLSGTRFPIARTDGYLWIGEPNGKANYGAVPSHSSVQERRERKRMSLVERSGCG